MKHFTKLLYVFCIVVFFSGCDHFASHIAPAEPTATKVIVNLEPVKLSTADKVYNVDVMGNGKVVGYYDSLAGNSTFQNREVDIKDLRPALKEAKDKYHKDLIVIIRPSDKASYKDLTNVMDEMAINIATRYVLQDWKSKKK